MPANVLRLPVTPPWQTPRGGETPPRGWSESARHRCQVSDPAGQVQRSADPRNWALFTWAVSQNTCNAETGAANADVCRKQELVLYFSTQCAQPLRPGGATSSPRQEGLLGLVNCFVIVSWPPVSKSKVWAQRSVACCTDKGPFDAGFWTISIKLTWLSLPL